jgi:RNA polymerase sigma-70 factor (ECF subfamily)
MDADHIDSAGGPPGQRVSPHDVLARDDELSRVRVATSRLSEEHRAVVLICYHGELSHADAAELLEIPLGTLKSRLHSALTRLREMLNSEKRDDDEEAC